MALSGGGTRGAAHVGVLTALEEEGLLPERIAGTSAGSIVAGLYAYGMEICDMRDLVRLLAHHGRSFLDPELFCLFSFLPQIITGRRVALRGLLKGNRLLKLLCRLTDGAELSEIPGGILIPAVDLRSGNTITFTNLFKGGIPLPALKQEHVKWAEEGKLCEIMMASSSVPAVFRPRTMEKWCLVDGGVTNNLPVDLLIAAGEKRVVAVDIGSDYEMKENQSILEIVSHSFSLMSRELKDCRSRGELLLLKPGLPEGAGLLTFDRMEECMEAGYIYTKKQAPGIRRMLCKKG